MPISTTKWSSVKGAVKALSNPDSCEAPDRSFIGHRDILTRSLARYHFVTPHVRGVTLDIGCGRGYGFDVIERNTTTRIGVDVSYDFLKEAQFRYPELSFARASGSLLSFKNASFDTVIAFEVIEHIEEDTAFLYEVKRLIRGDGLVAISTPNKYVSSGTESKPLNPFHVREYTAIEFYNILSKVFSSTIIYGQLEGTHNTRSVDNLIDRIPVSWKYMIPAHIQGFLSVALRAPLRIEDCRFQTEQLDAAHTFIALCRP